MKFYGYYKVGVALVIVCLVAIAAVIPFGNNPNKISGAKSTSHHAVKDNIPIKTANSVNAGSGDSCLEKTTKPNMSISKPIVVENGDTTHFPPMSHDTTICLKTDLRPVMPAEAQNWRNIREDLDNIYTKSDVLGIRKTCIKSYLEISEHANQQQDWTKRNMYRVAARSQLKKAVERFEELYKTSADHNIQKECMLAITELSYKAQDYDKAIAWGKKVIDESSDKNLQAYAYHYITHSFAELGNTANSQQFINLFFDKLPNEARKFYGGGDMTGNETFQLDALMRRLAFQYEMAERLDDMAIRFPKQAAMLKKQRDNQITMAKDAFSIAIVPLLGDLKN